MLHIRDGSGTFHQWELGEPKPTLTGVDYVKADGQELERVNNTAPHGLGMPVNSVVGQWVGCLAATVWANV